jgi:SAM-dependent methyltransferase
MDLIVRNQICNLILKLSWLRLLFQSIGLTFGACFLIWLLTLIVLRGRVSQNRHWLETRVLPNLVISPDPAVLVGLKSYNLPYVVAYGLFRELLVIEPNRGMPSPAIIERSFDKLENWRPAAAKYGLIDCNGVYGYGLDTGDALHQAVHVVHQALKPGGYLLFSVNHERDPENLANPGIRALVFSRFEEVAMHSIESAYVFIFKKIT